MFFIGPRKGQSARDRQFWRLGLFCFGEASINTQQVIQLIVILIAIVTVGFSWSYVRSHPEKAAYSVPPVSWLIHLIIFYAFVFLKDFFGQFTEIDFTLWSSIIRLQAAFLILGIMVMLRFERLIFNT